MNMIDKEEKRLSFSSIEPKLQLAWDSTSLGALKTCPRYYQYSILQGHVTHTENIHLRFGLEYHAALEHYHRERAKGIDYKDAVLSTVKHMLTSTWDNVLNRPWTSDLPNKNRETLIRTVIWYLDQYKDDPCETIILSNDKPAVELSFRFELGMKTELTHEDYLLCGHLDRGVTFNDHIWTVDYKTTKSNLDEKYFNHYLPDNQMSLYDNAGSIVFHEKSHGIIIDATQILVNSSRFQRYPLTRTPKQREEWMKDLVFYLKQNEFYVANNYWPMNDKSCNAYISDTNPRGCPYRSVCSHSPEIRPKILFELFTVRSWDPLVTREI